MKWRDCGYLSLTKDGKHLKVVLKHVTYFLKLEEAKDILDGKQGYTLVYEPSEQEAKT